MQDRTAVYIGSDRCFKEVEIDYLREKGLRVKTLARLSEEGMGWLEFFKADLILYNPIALGMPPANDNGVEFARRMRASANRDTPIVAYSVLTDQKVIAQLEEQHVIVVHYPDPDKFRETIDRLV